MDPAVTAFITLTLVLQATSVRAGKAVGKRTCNEVDDDDDGLGWIQRSK